MAVLIGRGEHHDNIHRVELIGAERYAALQLEQRQP